MSWLSPEKALIFRITHIANAPWILANGLHCRSSAAQDPDFEEIGNPTSSTSGRIESSRYRQAER